MDKNMIKIDDLLQQRLANGEEKERPGAWLRMQDLLDKEMPVGGGVVGAGAATNWRRMLGYAAALLLVGTATIGGYEAVTSYRADGTGNKHTNVAANTVSAPATVRAAASGKTVPVTPSDISKNNNLTVGRPSGSSASSNSNAANTGKPTDTKINRNAGKGTTGTSVTSSNASSAGSVGNHQNVAANKTTNDNKKQQNATNVVGRKQASTTANANAAQQQTATKQDKLTASSTQKEVKQSLSVNTGNSLNNKELAHVNSSENANGSIANNAVKPNTAAKSIDEAASAKAPAQGNVFASGVAATTKNNKTVQPVSNNKTGIAGTDKNKATATTTANKQNDQPVADKPTKTALVNKIETKETYTRENGWRKDTVDMSKVEWVMEQDEMMAMLEKKQATAADNTVLPASAANASAVAKVDEAPLVPLANYKVASTSAKSNYAKNQWIEQMIQNAKIGMGQIRFYPGVIVGANTNLKGSPMSGFQIGLVGNLSLNEKWGIFTELKYVQQFSQGKIKENFIGKTPVENQGLSGMEYTWKNNAVGYSYPTVGSIELPIAVRYFVKRFNLFAGANIVYHLPVKYGEDPVSATDIITFVKVAPEGQLGQNIYAEQDFGARLAFGGVFGIAYQLSPAWTLDMRVTQSFADNANTAGAKIIAKEIYRNPGVQLNMSYRFGSNRNRPAPAR